MLIPSLADLGLLKRSVRRASGVHIDEEHGKPTVQLGFVIELLGELGMPRLGRHSRSGKRRTPRNQAARPRKETETPHRKVNSTPPTSL